jgi:hypothetical protein
MKPQNLDKKGDEAVEQHSETCQSFADYFAPKGR